MPPRCNYSLRRDSPNGAVMESAAVGQILFHRWECDGGEDSIDVFGILIHDCRASNISSVSANSAQPYQIIDRNGCSADPSLLGEVVYAEDRLLAFAKAFVFTIKDVDSLRFSCKVSMCLRNGDGCEGYSPPMCNSTNISELLLSNTQHGERMHDSSLESALTGELDSPKLVVMPSPAALAGTNPRHLTQRARRLTTPYLVTMVLIAAVVLGSLLGVVCFVVSRRCWPTRKRSPSSLLERANDSDVCSANGAESNSSQRSPAETRYQPDLLVDWAGRRITRLGTPPTALRNDRVFDAGTRNSDNDEDWKSVASTVEGAGDTATSEHQRLATLRHQPDAL
ncbi:zona pellucida-like domain-containing protein [Ditylenchus destructor]|nr:zona pellucida-like domain-containing protein [Ditylenchus destructor]